MRAGTARGDGRSACGDGELQDLLTGVLCCTERTEKGIRRCGNREEGMGKLMEAWGSLYPTNSSSMDRIGAEL
jgi:hypothetical protein